MEFSPPQNESEKVNEALKIKSFLQNYNFSLPKRFDGLETSNQHRVYEVNDFALLANEPSFSDTEKDLLVCLSNAQEKGDRSQDLLDGIEIFFKKSLSVGDKEKLSPGDPKAKLRRTAAILYKNAQIPDQTISRGFYKEVTGPIGADPLSVRENTQKVIDNIGQIWSWDGNLPEVAVDEYQDVKESSQYVFVHSNPKLNFSEKMKLDGLKYETGILKAILGDDRLKKLGDNGTNGPAKYLPKIIQETKKGYFIENISGEFPSGDIKTRIQDVLQAVTGLEELWKKTGNVLTDVKVQNLRKRANGEVVFVDLGSRVKIEPGDDVKYLSFQEVTFEYIPPEIADTSRSGDKSGYSIEKMITFQAGLLLLQSIYVIK